MTKIIRVSLTPEERSELNRRARQRVLAPRLRDRMEMIRLSDLGWTIPRIAISMGINEQTVRKHLKAFLAQGFDALPDRPRPGRPRSVTPADLDALEQTIRESAPDGRSWRTSDMVRWLADRRGVTVTARHLSRLLHQRDSHLANQARQQHKRAGSRIRRPTGITGWRRGAVKAVPVER